MTEYPKAVNVDMIGKYDLLAKSGGGGRYDEVLAYRLWVREEGQEVWCKEYSTYEEALADAIIFKNKDNIMYVHFMVLLRQEWIYYERYGNLVIEDMHQNVEWQPDWLLSENEIYIMSKDEIREQYKKDKSKLSLR